ncbi:MAG: TonB-dependent receptor [Myxococcota bacterium]
MIGLWSSTWLTAVAQPVAEDDYEIVVIGQSEIESREDATERTIQAEEAERVPGVQGDAVKAVQTVAGVARNPIGQDGLTIWGGSPTATRLYIDDIPVPRLFHRGGLRSILPSHAVKTIRLVPGAPSARYGRGLGGVVAVNTQGPPDTNAGFRLHADPIDVGGSAHVKLGSVTLAGGGRVGVLGRLADGFLPADLQQLIPIPDTWDYQARLHGPSQGGTLTVLAFGSGDRTERGIPALTPDAGFTERTDVAFHRVGIRLVRHPVTLQRTSLLLWGGLDRDTVFLDFRDVTAEEQRTATSLGALLVHERTHGPLRLRGGLDAELQSTEVLRDGALSLPAREGDVQVFGQPPGNRVNLDVWSARQAGVGGFVSARFDFGAIRLEPGLRLEPSVTDGSRILPVRPTEPPVGFTRLRVFTDPRLQARLRLSPRVSLIAAGGRLHQPPDAGDLSPIFGNPQLDHGEAWHAVAGVLTRPLARWTAELLAFRVRQRDLAVRSPSPTPALASALVNAGEGRAIGAQLTMRVNVPRAVASLSATWQRSERRNGADLPWRRFDLDQPFNLQLAASWQPEPFELGARLEVTSGFPRTPVEGAIFDARQQSFDPIFGPQNSERLPMFLSLSTRIAWAPPTRIGRTRLWLDVVNVTNRANVEEIFYSADYRERGTIRGLPIVPVLGVEVVF